MISKFDLHIHSKYSYDSIMRPEKIIKVAKQKGLTGIAITDHGTIEGGLAAKKCSKDFIVIVGAEIKTEEFGDIIGLFLNEEIKSREIWCVIDEMKDQDGIVVLPHPLRDHTNIFNGNLLNKIDAIEGYNARTGIDENIKAKEFADKSGLPAIAGSDAHFYGEIGLAKTIVEDASSEEDIRRSILSDHIAGIEGSQTSIYYRGGSRVLTDIKKGRIYRLPYTIMRVSFKGAKACLSKIVER
jgi:hypothetical protein